MGTPFITFLGPSNLDGYDSKNHSSRQPDNIPATFIDAMEVREQVFVEEQGVPLNNEFDSDDRRACHWVIYASVNTLTDPEVKDSSGEIITRKKSTTRSTPIGTIRLVPFPHPPHPEPGSHYTAESLETSTPSHSQSSSQSSLQPPTSTINPPRYIHDRPTTYHDGREPYLKLGRLAVLREFRGAAIARLLVSAAMTWARSNPTYFNPSIKALGMEKVAAKVTDDVPVWNGLLCVHAQEQAAKAWEKWGFDLDEGMGQWSEEGINHVGMFARLDLRNSNS